MTWYEIFPRILNMSLTASVIICVVLLCRLLLKRAPKIYSYILWSVVIFRLLCPVSLLAPVSILGIFDTPVMEQTSENMDDEGTVTSTVAYIPADIVHTEYPKVTLPIPGVGDRVSEAVNERLPSGEEQLGADPLEFPVTFATYLWMFGIIGMLAGGLASYVRLRGNMVGALHLQDNVYVTDHIPGPLVVGMIKPKIYLPSDLDVKEHSYIILHEKQHIRRGDPIFKMVAYIALCIHWFNPLVWLFFKLFVKDMEMSCDEAVIQKMGESIRADYSASLLQLATGHRMLFGSPLAFGETEPAGRIKNLSGWKKPTIVISAFAIVLCMITVVVSIFNPIVSKDTLRMIGQESPVMGNMVKYEVDFGKQVKEANIYAEVWEKGECEIMACLPVDQKANVLSIRMKDRKAAGKTEGVDIRLESDVPGGMQVTYAELPEELSVIGWAFNAYEEGDTVDAISGEEKILAAMAFDTGEGVRVFDPETLLKEPSRLEQAEYMLVIRAVFEEEGSRLDSGQTIQVSEPKQDTTILDKEEDTPAVAPESAFNQAIYDAILNHYKPEKPDGLYHCADFILLEQEEICGVAPVNSGRDNIELITVYGMALHESLGFSGAAFHEVEYDYVPVKLKFQKESEYILKDSWFPEKPYESWDIYQEAIWDVFSPYSKELATDMIYAIQDEIYLTSLRQNCYEQAVSYGTVDTDTVIEGLLEEIVASPGGFARGSKDYMVVNGAAYKELIHYGKYTLWYCFGEFLEGGQTDLRGHIMASVCRDIMLGFGEAMLNDKEAAHGQEWFDMFFAIARSTEKQYTEEDLKIYYPGSWLLIKLADLKEVESKETVSIEELDWEKILKDHLNNENYQ